MLSLFGGSSSIKKTQSDAARLKTSVDRKNSLAAKQKEETIVGTVATLFLPRCSERGGKGMEKGGSKENVHGHTALEGRNEGRRKTC